MLESLMRKEGAQQQGKSLQYPIVSHFEVTQYLRPWCLLVIQLEEHEKLARLTLALAG